MNAAEKIKAKYLQMALKLVGLPIDFKTAVLITKVVNKLDNLGGDFSLMDAAKIEVEINNYDNKELHK